MIVRSTFLFVRFWFIPIVLGLALVGILLWTAGHADLGVAAVHGGFALLSLLLAVGCPKWDGRLVGLAAFVVFGGSAWVHALGAV